MVELYTTLLIVHYNAARTSVDVDISSWIDRVLVARFPLKLQLAGSVLPDGVEAIAKAPCAEHGYR